MFLKGVTNVSTVKNAARFAVYDETIIRMKNHHTPAAILVEIPLKPITIENKISKQAIQLHGCYFRPLLHQTSYRKPQRISYAELVDQELWFFNARVRVGPFARGQSPHYEKAEGNHEVGNTEEQPNAEGKWREKHEEAGRNWFRFSVENADAQVHEGHSEVNGAFSF